MPDSILPANSSNNTVPAIYGYTVCLIAVLLFLAGSIGVVNNAFRTVNPGLGSHHRMSMGWLHSRGFHGFGRREGAFGRLNAAQGTSPDVARTARARLNAVRALTVSLVLLIISIVLFRGHWRWLNGPR